MSEDSLGAGSPDTLISTGAAADRGQSTDFIGAARHAVQALSAYAYQEASSLVPANRAE